MQLSDKRRNVKWTSMRMGFSLFELLVVIAIILIVAAMVVEVLHEILKVVHKWR
jgi:prepilin-type N-terminal cleavage/methylation domain-containing protein